MAKKLTLSILSDAGYIGIRANLTPKEFERFLNNPDAFEDDRVPFIWDSAYVRETLIMDDKAGGLFHSLDETIYDNTIDPFDEYSYYDEDNDSDDPVRKELCDELKKRIELYYKSIENLAPNSFTVFDRWHIYKEGDSYSFELEDNEEFHEGKLQFVIDNYLPDWLVEWGKKTDDWLDFIFIEDRIWMMNIVYDGKIIGSPDTEDLGGNLVRRYVVKTDENGAVESIEELTVD